VTSHRNWLLVYEKYDGEMVYLGNDSPLSIVGHGRFLIKLPNGIVKRINGVFHIMCLAQNLLSIRTLNDACV
jgi:hypothetical protein